MITAPADVVIFLEYIPHQLEKRLLDDDKTDLSKVEKEVLTVTAFMKTRGFAHCDAHFRNILTDDSHVYFTDFGLSMSRAFELSPEEHAFLEEHSDFDRYSVAAELAWLAVASSLGEEGTHARVDEYLSSSDKAQTLPPSVAAVASRYGAVAKLTYQFLDDLRATKTTPYPKEALDREWSKIHSN